MQSRRHFLHAAPSVLGLAWATLARAEEKAQEQKPDPLLTPAAQKSIASGLKYLLAQQHRDGSFGTGAYKGSVGITSLCGLALISAGHTPGVGAAGAVLDSAIDFTLSKEDARGLGYLHNPAASPHGAMYNHGFAVWFLASALDLVKNKARAKKVKEVLGRAVLLTLAAQNAEKGWRYLPTSQDSDLTVTSCQLCGLRAAREAGFGVPRATLEGGVRYVKSCQDRTGGFHYMARHGAMAQPNWVRTAAALLALYSAGVTRGKEVERGLTYLLDNRPKGKGAKADLHYFYGHLHAALATWAAGGEARKKWYPTSRDELIERQEAAGSWKDPISPHYGTAAALIALQAPLGRLSPEF